MKWPVLWGWRRDSGRAEGEGRSVTDLRGSTLNEIAAEHGDIFSARDWLAVELRAGRIRRYWRGQGEALAVYRVVG